MASLGRWLVAAALLVGCSDDDRSGDAPTVERDSIKQEAVDACRDFVRGRLPADEAVFDDGVGAADDGVSWRVAGSVEVAGERKVFECLVDGSSGEWHLRSLSID